MEQLHQFGSLNRTADSDRWEGAGDRRDAQPYAAKGLAGAPVPQPVGCRASLARTIELDIIPRLVRAHCPAPAQRPVEGSDGLGARAAAEYTQRVLDGDGPGAQACLAELRARGASSQWQCAEVLAPAARRLGALWQNDLGEFEHVSLALWRLQQLASVARIYASSDTGSPRALLIPAPGEEHTVGLGILAETLRRGGWVVWAGPSAPIEFACAQVASGRFDLVALSVGCHSRLDLVDASIRAVRAAAAGRDLGVLIAGPQEVEPTTG